MTTGISSRIFKISPDLRLFPCLVMDVTIGDLKNDSLANLMQKAADAFAQVESPRSDICGNCHFLVKCEGCFAEGLLHKDLVEECIWYEDNKKWLNAVAI